MSAAGAKRRHPPRSHWVCWNPWEMMEAAEDLSATEELAYLRIVQLTIKGDGKLRDDDAVLPIATKAGRHWKAVKASLVAKGKIEVVDGLIHCAVAADMCDESRAFRAQRSAAAVESHKSPKRLKNKQTAPAAAGASAGAGAPANEQITKEELRSSRPAAGPRAVDPERPDLFRDGLRDFSALLGEPPKACGGRLGKLRKAARGDDALVLACIAAAKERVAAGGVIDNPFVWIMGAIGTRLQERAAAAAPVPETVRGVNIEKLEVRCSDLFEEISGRGICFEGRWPGFRAMLAELIAEGAEPPDHILPIVRAAARRGFVPDRLGWFRQEFQRAMQEGKNAA